MEDNDSGGACQAINGILSLPQTLANPGSYRQTHAAGWATRQSTGGTAFVAIRPVRSSGAKYTMDPSLNISPAVPPAYLARAS